MFSLQATEETWSYWCGRWPMFDTRLQATVDWYSQSFFLSLSLSVCAALFTQPTVHRLLTVHLSHSGVFTTQCVQHFDSSLAVRSGQTLSSRVNTEQCGATVKAHLLETALLKVSSLCTNKLLRPTSACSGSYYSTVKILKWCFHFAGKKTTTFYFQSLWEISNTEKILYKQTLPSHLIRNTCLMAC